MLSLLLWLLVVNLILKSFEAGRIRTVAYAVIITSGLFLQIIYIVIG